MYILQNVTAIKRGFENPFSYFNGNGYLSRVTILRTKKLTLTYLSKTKTTFQVSVGLVLTESETTSCQQAGSLNFFQN